MSTAAEADLPQDMTAEAFFAWAEEGNARYELVKGRPAQLQSERASHNKCKASAWLALRNGIQAAGVDCTAFTDGMSVRVDDWTVREPDALVHCGSFDGKDIFASNPIVIVEVISPSSIRSDAGIKLIDYFRVPSIQHYLILYGDEERVVHHRRSSVEGEIATRILGRGDVADLSPPGFSVAVEALFDS